MQKLFSSLTRHQETLTVHCSVLDVEGQVDCRERSCKVRNHTGKTNVESFTRHILQRECLDDRYLRLLLALAYVGLVLAYEVTPDTLAHINIRFRIGRSHLA
jgi:hypothetical protein